MSNIEVNGDVQTSYTVLPNSVVTPLLKMRNNCVRVYICLARRCFGDSVECWPSVATIMQETFISRQSVFDALAELEAGGLITRHRQSRSDGSQATTKYRLEGVRDSRRGGTKFETPRGTENETGGGTENETPIPLKKHKIEEVQDEETKNGRAHSFVEVTSSRVIAYLNQTAGRRFDPAGGNCKQLHARVREAGARGAEAFEANARRVIDLKVNEWGSDAKMSRFLRPETLFNSEKWPTYLEESSRSSNGRYLMTPEDIDRAAAELK